MSKNVLRNKAGTCAAYGGHIEPDKKKKVTFDLNVIDESEFNVVVGRGQRQAQKKMVSATDSNSSCVPLRARASSLDAAC